MEDLKTDNRTGARYYIKKDPAAGTDFICLNVPCTQFFFVGEAKKIASPFTQFCDWSFDPTS